MRGMAPGAREAYVAKKEAERASLQKKIAEVSASRDKFIQAERQKRARSSTKALDDALNGAVRSEAEAAGFAF
jgi:hypothetical protein